MTTPFLAGTVASLVGSPLSRYGSGGTSYPFTVRDANRRAWLRVEHGADDWAEVRGIDGKSIVFRAWRVSATSFAWQTSLMPAPAFVGAYTPHDAPEVVAGLGTFCSGCGEPLKGTTR